MSTAPRWILIVPALMFNSLALAGDRDSTAGLERVQRLWNPEAILQQMCEGISRQYDLDDDQHRAACAMLTARASEFAEEHGRELWPLLADLAPLGLTDTPPDPATARDIAQRARPILVAARKEILDAMDEFRKMLNDDQKRTHDRDLKALHRLFDGIDQRLGDWGAGKVRQPDRGVPPRRIQSPANTVAWEAFTDSIIETYALDADQTRAARALLADQRQLAANYLAVNGSKLRHARDGLAAAERARPVDLAAAEQARARVQIIEEPLLVYFRQLQARMNDIPTPAQRAKTRDPLKRPEPAAGIPATANPF